LIFGNGRILICEDEKGIIRDVYFPYVGLENHGYAIRTGICDLDQGPKRCSWFDSWNVEQKYKSSFKDRFCAGSFPPLGVEGSDESCVIHGLVSNIGETVFENPGMGLKVMVWDAVHPSLNYLCRVFEIQNQSTRVRNLRLFSNQNYRILENNIGETAVIDGDVLIHYKRNRYLLHASKPQFDQFAVGTAQWHGLEGTWKDMEKDGVLSGNVVAHGSVDSTLGWTLKDIEPGEARTVQFWIVLGKNYQNVISAHKIMKGSGSSAFFHIVFNFWNSFVERISVLPEHEKVALLSQKVRDTFYRSLIAVVAHMDMNGSVVASSDSQIKQFGADLYTYCWPRDAAWACIALDRARHGHLSNEIFNFFTKTITRRGYFLHKYTPAGDFGSTWHPVPMIQIDETGLPLCAVYHNWLTSRNVWVTSRYFGSLVSPAANYLAGSLDPKTGLPRSSFDLWEERKGVHTYSACTVYGGLSGSSKLAGALGNDDEFERWTEAANRVKSGILEHLYDDQLGRFKRSLDDTALDSSLFAVWYFGILPPEDERVVRTMKAIEEDLQRPSGGIARYLHDTYQGYMNSWIICTLWLAQWHIAMGNLDRASELISWCADHAHPTGLMPEQVADDGTFRSVLPLMWSHAAFILAVLEYLAALKNTLGSKARQNQVQSKTD